MIPPGPNLAAATTLELAVRGERIPDRLVLIAGTIDNRTQPHQAGIDDQIVTSDSLAAALASYLSTNDDPNDYRVSPVSASRALLSQFPPTLLQASTIETLLHDTKTFAARLEEAGVRTNVSIWPELPHVWHAFLGLFPEATEALQEIADFIDC